MVFAIGELRNYLSQDLQENLQEIINQKQEDSNYYILIYSDIDYFDPDRINTKIFTLREDQKPSKMFGTICFYVDNSLGNIELKWILPLDIPTKGMVDENIINEQIGEDGQKMGQFLYNQ